MKKIILVLPFLLLGCGNPFGDAPSHIESAYGPETRQTSPSSIELVSASLNQKHTTTLGRKPEISVGTTTDKIKLKTSLDRTVFLSVQGQIISQ